MVNNYAECVDHLVSNMSKPDAPFDTDAYANYKALVDKEREKIDPDNLVESIYKIGYRIDTLLSKLIGQLDVILEDDFDPDKVTCSVDDKKVDCDTWEDQLQSNQQQSNVPTK